MSAGIEIDRVVREGDHARTELARDLARAFRQRPAAIAPRHLERLGNAGLGIFLREIGAPRPAARNSAAGSQVHQHRAKPMNISGASASGWPDMRCGAWPEWLAGATAGLRGGMIVTGVGAILILAERLIPLVGEIVR